MQELHEKPKKKSEKETPKAEILEKTEKEKLFESPEFKKMGSEYFRAYALIPIHRLF